MESKRLRKGQPYIIYWNDHHAQDSGGAWVTADTLKLEQVAAISAGWVVKQDRTKVALAQTVDHKIGIKGEVGNVWYILKSDIYKVIPITLNKKAVQDGSREANVVEDRA